MNDEHTEAMPDAQRGLVPAVNRPVLAIRNPRASLTYCQHITAAANSSFPLAFRLLPIRKRNAMNALYAFMRVTDDLADEPGEIAAKRQSLAEWRAGLLAALDGHASHPVHPALADAITSYSIPVRYLLDVIDGVEADLEPVAYSTFAELYPYCYRVASAVGLACVRVWELRPGVSFNEADAPAEAAGIAFQITNILRDLGEDLAHGRVYLPTEELKSFGSPPETWSQPQARTAFVEMMSFQIARARAFYEQAESLEGLLSAEGRPIYRVMCGTYRQLLDEIERCRFDVFSRRVRVPRWRKGMILAQGWAMKCGWA